MHMIQSSSYSGCGLRYSDFPCPGSPQTPNTKLKAHRCCVCLNVWQLKHHTGFRKYGCTETLYIWHTYSWTRRGSLNIKNIVLSGNGFPSHFPISQYALETEQLARAVYITSDAASKEQVLTTSKGVEWCTGLNLDRVRPKKAGF
jgi:hypothetical protein